MLKQIQKIQKVVCHRQEKKKQQFPVTVRKMLLKKDLLMVTKIKVISGILKVTPTLKIFCSNYITYSKALVV